MQNGHHTKDLQTVGVLAANECKEEQCELRSHPAGDWSGQYKQLFFLSNKKKKKKNIWWPLKKTIWILFYMV